MFSWGIERDHWHEMGQYTVIKKHLFHHTAAEKPKQNMLMFLSVNV